jgi:hypothetical protein
MTDATTPPPKRYFYCCSVPVEVGSVVRPGNWGRIMRLYTPQSAPNAWILVRELAYELVRVRSFPQKPSRFDSLFVCTSEADLRDFRIGAGRLIDLCYEVELVDPAAPSHFGDRTLPNLQNTDDLQVFMNRAALYWQGASPIVKEELVTLSPIRITRAL